jgi:hypothetical protein
MVSHNESLKSMGKGDSMRQITLRGITDDIETLAQKESKSKGVSLNKAFLSLLRKGAEQQARAGQTKKSRSRSEFSQFLGLWSEDETAVFDESLREQREIDKGLWS